MTNLAYRRLVTSLLLARELAGGELSQDEEAERADELDMYWQRMTEDERSMFESELRGSYAGQKG